MDDILKPGSPENWFHVRAALYVETQLLFHLNQVGVFKLLYAEGPATAEQIAEKLDLKTDPLKVMLEYIEGVDNLIARDVGERFDFTPFGREVTERYGRDTPTGREFNFFDVRAGAYGPIWASADQLLKGTAVYGENLDRRGSLAAGALYKSAHSMAPALMEILNDLQVETAMEWGVETGLLECVAESLPNVQLMGLDRNEDEIETARKLAANRQISGIDWVHADLFEPEKWSERVSRNSPGAFFSIHLHEFASKGTQELQEFLGKLRGLFAGWHLVIFEQPRLPLEDRGNMPASRWLYSQANVLIHHLIKNGKILSEQEWVDLFEGAGCSIERISATNFLDYRTFVVRF